MNRNIAYQTEQLARYFSRNRVTWPQFYESERLMIDGLSLDARYERLCFCAFSIREGNEHGEALRLQLKLPAEIQDVMEVA